MPFTTLQTYFHRARAQLERDFAESRGLPPPAPEPELGEEAELEATPPASPPASGSAFLDALGITGKKETKSAAASAIWAKLLAKTQAPPVPSEEGRSPTATPPAAPTGSSKRKPKRIVRHLDVGEGDWNVESGAPESLSGASQDSGGSEEEERRFLANNRNISDYVRQLMQPDPQAADGHNDVARLPS